MQKKTDLFNIVSSVNYSASRKMKSSTKKRTFFHKKERKKWIGKKIKRFNHLVSHDCGILTPFWWRNLNYHRQKEQRTYGGAQQREMWLSPHRLAISRVSNLLNATEKWLTHSLFNRSAAQNEPNLIRFKRISVKIFRHLFLNLRTMKINKRRTNDV